MAQKIVRLSKWAILEAPSHLKTSAIDRLLPEVGERAERAEREAVGATGATGFKAVLCIEHRAIG